MGFRAIEATPGRHTRSRAEAVQSVQPQTLAYRICEQHEVEGSVLWIGHQLADMLVEVLPQCLVANVFQATVKVTGNLQIDDFTLHRYDNTPELIEGIVRGRYVCFGRLSDQSNRYCSTLSDPLNTVEADSA